MPTTNAITTVLILYPFLIIFPEEPVVEVVDPLDDGEIDEDVDDVITSDVVPPVVLVAANADVVDVDVDAVVAVDVDVDVVVIIGTPVY